MLLAPSLAALPKLLSGQTLAAIKACEALAKNLDHLGRALRLKRITVMSHLVGLSFHVGDHSKIAPTPGNFIPFFSYSDFGVDFTLQMRPGR